MVSKIHSPNPNPRLAGEPKVQPLWDKVLNPHLWQATFNLNERILKLWKSTHPSGTKVDETIFPTFLRH
jgi:hypothetical protein